MGSFVKTGFGSLVAAWISIYAISVGPTLLSTPSLSHGLRSDRVPFDHQLTNNNVTGFIHSPVGPPILPLQDAFRISYDEIEYLKLYFGHIPNSHTKRLFHEELQPSIEDFQTQITKEYTQLFKDIFPHRIDETASLTGPQYTRAQEGVLHLLQKLDKQHRYITTWAYQRASIDLRHGDTRLTILQQGKSIWTRQFQHIKTDIDAILAQFSYHGHPLRYVGSLTRGRRGSHKGGSVINLSDFDVDLFVVYAEEWRRNLPVMRERFPEKLSNGKMYPLGTHMYELGNLSYAVGCALMGNMTGRFVASTEIVLREVDTYY